MRKHRKALAGLAILAIGMVPATPVDAAPGDGITPFATGLNGPGGIDYQYGKVYVAEGSTGKIISANPDTKQVKTELSGFANPADVARVGNELVVVTAGAEIPDASLTGDSTVYVAKPGGTPKALADLEKYELENNPDGQLQFDPVTNEPLDALSNPFAIIRDRRSTGFVFVVDAGANAVLAVDSRGKVSTFFVPPNINTGPCAGAPNNDPQHPGCDSVPTDIVYGTDGNLYVTTLNGLIPGEGRVYVLDPRNGAVKRTIGGLTAPTGVATDNRGNVYTSEVTFGAPEGEGPPPEGFEPNKVGRIVKTDRNGDMTQADVTMPVGLAVNTYDNSLYASSWALGSMFGIPDVGQLVKVKQSDFHEITETPAEPPAQNLS